MPTMSYRRRYEFRTSAGAWKGKNEAVREALAELGLDKMAKEYAEFLRRRYGPGVDNITDQTYYNIINKVRQEQAEAANQPKSEPEEEHMPTTATKLRERMDPELEGQQLLDYQLFVDKDGITRSKAKTAEAAVRALGPGQQIKTYQAWAVEHYGEQATISSRTFAAARERLHPPQGKLHPVQTNGMPAATTQAGILADIQLAQQFVARMGGLDQAIEVLTALKGMHNPMQQS